MSPKDKNGLKLQPSNSLRVVGFFLIGIGAVIAFYGFFFNETWTTCPLTGCTPEVLQRLRDASTGPFIFGLFVIVLGVGLLVASRLQERRAP